MALPRGAMGLSAVCDCVFPDHTHLLYLQLSHWRRERAGCFTFLVCFMPSVCYRRLPLPHGDIGWSALYMILAFSDHTHLPFYKLTMAEHLVMLSIADLYPIC